MTRSWRFIFAKALIRPFALFVREPIIQLIGIYMAFIYGIFYRTSSTIIMILPTIESKICLSIPHHYARNIL